ncbi:MAG: sulfotransferase [Pseudaminobacter sp.]|nr:sulfotransferase [Pseudaminobacter sp.]
MPKHFFIIGAQRSGTSYLAQILDSHPQIELAKPLRPEPKFFLKDIGGLDRSAYCARFFAAPKPGAKLFGEKSTSYLESIGAGQRIRTMCPDARLLILLRNPVDRAISNVRFSQSNGFEPLSLVDALQRELDRPEEVVSAQHAGISVSPQAYLKRGRYVDFLQPYVDLFGRDKMGILITEDFVGSSDAISQLFRWLGVDNAFSPPNINNRINAGEPVTSAPVPAGVRRRLRDYFSDVNGELAARFDVDIDAWNAR